MVPSAKRSGKEIFESIVGIDIVRAVGIDEVLGFDVGLIVRDDDDGRRRADLREVLFHPGAHRRVWPDVEKDEMNAADVACVEHAVAW